MTSQGNPTTYSFLEFNFIPSQHLLQHQNQNIQLSKKNHNMLLALVETKGDVIEKDELIARIWPQQIVTDAALNKQITRLRKTLAEYDSNPIIETIRGVGIRLIPEVSIENRENENTHKTKKQSGGVVAAIILIGALVLWQLNQSQNTETKNWDSINTVNMAIIPSFADSDWLNVGTIDYLSKQLSSHPNLQALEPESDWFKRSDNGVLGVELSQLEGIEYVLMLENRNNHNGYSTDLVLRNSDQIVAKKSFDTNSLNLLLNQIETWTLQQLSIETELAKNEKKQPNQTTDFVMESYLRGLAAARSRSYEKATLLLNTAIEQDPSFYPAWLTLADVETELGNFDKALGLINTLTSSGKLSTELAKKLTPIQVKNLIYLNRLDEAQTILNQSLQQAQADQDINIIMYNMNNQLLLNDYSGDNDESEIALGEELLALTKKFDPSPNQIGMREHNLAIILNQQSKEEQAISYIKMAVNNFATANNYEGLLSSYRVWAEIHAYLAQFGDARLVLEKAEPYLSQVEGARTLVHYWIAYGWINYELGDLSAFQQSIDALNQMSVDYASLQPKVKALVLEADMAIAYGQYRQARTAVNTLLEIVVTRPDDYPTDAPYVAALDIYLTARTEPAAVAKAKRTKYLSAYPELAEWIGHELMFIDAHIMATEGYKLQATKKLASLENIYLKTGDISFANDTNYAIIRLLIDQLADEKSNQVVKAALERLAGRDHFAYPFKKFKAQWLVQQNKLIQAITLMSELKAQAKDFWTPQDQLLLEKWQQENTQNKE